jgi:glyoxylase I family protein
LDIGNSAAAQETSMHIEKIHHVAYRCKDAKATADWYREKLGMELLFAFSEEQVPSTKEAHPYMHVFLDAGNGNVLAFFELPESPPMGFDPNTPGWVQHLALQVPDMATLLDAKLRLESQGVAVPSGSPEMVEALRAVSAGMLEEWSRTSRPPRQAAWVHQAEFAKTAP